VVGALDRAGAAMLERDRRTGVRAKPPAAGRGLVDRVTDDGVAEREAPGRAAGSYERPLEQLVERVQGRRVVQLRDLRRQRRPERVTDHRRRIEEPPCLRRQPPQLRGQRRPDRGRHRVAADARAARLSFRAHQLLEVERVASAVAIHRVSTLPDQRARLRLAQRAETQPRSRCGHQRRRELTGPRRDGEQHRSRRRAVGERGEHVERSRVRPVDIVEADHERPHRREPLEQVTQGAVDAVAIAGQRPAAEHGQDAGQRGGVGQAEACQPPFSGVREVPVERLRPQRVGQVRLVLGGARRERRAALGRRVAE
jgi:hypothetical protein